jgi:hypothetical protein
MRSWVVYAHQQLLKDHQAHPPRRHEPSVVFGWTGGKTSGQNRLRKPLPGRESMRVSSDVRQEMWEKFLFIVDQRRERSRPAPVGVLRTTPSTRPARADYK